MTRNSIDAGVFNQMNSGSTRPPNLNKTASVIAAVPKLNLQQRNSAMDSSF